MESKNSQILTKAKGFTWQPVTGWEIQTGRFAPGFALVPEEINPEAHLGWLF